MAKTITPKRYSLGDVGNQLKDKTDTEKAKFKAQEMAKIALTAFSKNDIDVTILDQLREINGLLYVIVSATKNGKELNVDNPLIFKNPPIMIHDGTFHVKKDSLGNDVEIMNYEENVEEALKEIITDTIRILNE